MLVKPADVLIWRWVLLRGRELLSCKANSHYRKQGGRQESLGTQTHGIVFELSAAQIDRVLHKGSINIDTAGIVGSKVRRACHKGGRAVRVEGACRELMAGCNALALRIGAEFAPGCWNPEVTAAGVEDCGHVLGWVAIGDSHNGDLNKSLCKRDVRKVDGAY